ncbi:MAG: KamA family radical SAM protein [Gammaproteobacteria bacterium]
MVEKYTLDPLKEKQVELLPGLLHKYYGRALILLTNECATYCPFCFRKHFLKDKKQLSLSELNKIYAYLRQNNNISEVILSGGDPLFVKAEYLAKVLADLAEIHHLKRLRIHTRLPIADPSLINAELIAALISTRFKPVLVIHCNHADEIDEKVIATAESLRAAGIILLNQSVLLHGVNDSVKTLVNLSEKLAEIGVMPYYLHLLDKVEGAEYFAVSVTKARTLQRKLRSLLPGYLVPRLVQEIPGEKSKTLL